MPVIKKGGKTIHLPYSKPITKGDTPKPRPKVKPPTPRKRGM